MFDGMEPPYVRRPVPALNADAGMRELALGRARAAETRDHPQQSLPRGVPMSDPAPCNPVILVPGI
jgi:hypothetical protein